MYRNALTGKAVRYPCIIVLRKGRLLDVRVSQHSYREGCLIFVYHNAPTGKVVRCLCIITLQQERLLDVSVS